MVRQMSTREVVNMCYLLDSLVQINSMQKSLRRILKTSSSVRMRTGITVVKIHDRDAQVTKGVFA